MECPRPQPGHHVKPIALRGHRLKCAGSAGFAKANDANAATQNVNSKYFENSLVVRFIAFRLASFGHYQ